MTSKPRLLVISRVRPFPRNAGQQQRVYYKLKAFRDLFHVTFLTTETPNENKEDLKGTLLEYCEDAILLKQRYGANRANRIWHRIVGFLYTAVTGLKFSNYVVTKVEFCPSRIASALCGRPFSVAVYEYWHAVDTVPVLQRMGIPCVLDTHDVLWQSRARQLSATSKIPGWWKRWAVEQYRRREEAAWSRFDGLIAINASERDYIRDRVREEVPVFYAPMGTDLTLWPYCWDPVSPPRIAYYGGLASPHNQQDALTCCDAIMPEIWRHLPDAELWLVGSSPPESLRACSDRDPRIKVTGYVERAQELLGTMRAVVCPWTGTYGFRSRLVEVMALGVPVVASPDAVHGMGMEGGRGLFLEGAPEHMARACLRLIRDPDFAREQSQLAREQMEEKFSFDATYGRLARELSEFVAGTAETGCGK